MNKQKQNRVNPTPGRQWKSSIKQRPLIWLLSITNILLLGLFVSSSFADAVRVDLTTSEVTEIHCDGRNIRAQRITRQIMRIECQGVNRQATPEPTVIAPTAVPPTTIPPTAVPPTPLPPADPIQPEPTAPSPDSQPDPVPVSGFIETFDGDPARPQSYADSPWAENWDVTVHSRDNNRWYDLDPMEAAHGPNCEAPPTSHTVTAYEDAVFNCKNHMMTAINAIGYGAIYLTPNQMVDFSAGEAIIRYDMSTLRTSPRDWVDVWITPYDQHLQLPLDSWLPDLQGKPHNGIQIRMNIGQNSFFQAYYLKNGRESSISGNNWTGYENFLTPDPRRRDTFEIRISQTHLSFCMPDYNFCWVDTDIAPLDWNMGVVQIGHHSYNPKKDGGQGPNTYHWDNVQISPAVPFNMIKADRRYARPDINVVNFAQPAPANAHLRFAGIGQNLQVSFDNGATWQTAQKQPQLNNSGHFSSYFTPIPAGTQSVMFRGERWWGGDWHVRDLSIWSR